ncbi:enhanced intracellular survival protein Eis [Microlunatus sp. Gsoil 973]|uniref:GNAT family N-acetyltransferase n=1 Tax=Microlunatus sp. Gsoil 973 TaxID=2672569 RepID=UPI0018A81310|nr:GNAT family N-acetyltransferase [Microlunatus sp. Gsoil 973]
MDFEIRTPTQDEAERFWRLGHEAFGFPPTPSEPGSIDRPGAIPVVAMDGETMAGRMVDRDYDCWFGGKLVPTSGIGGVTVAMEYRGQGLLAPLFTELFRIAKNRGAVISALYPSSVGIYRRLGYEVICTSDPARFPISALARITAPEGVRTRRATAADGPAIREAYDVWAAANNGPLSRRGASFPVDDEELIKSFTGITVAERDGTIIGYTSWNRGPSFGPDGELQVFDLIAAERDGYRALLAALGSYASIVGWIKIENASGLDLVLQLFPTSEWQVLDSQPYMLKIIDVVGALQARGYPTVISTTVEFGVAGDPITGTDGHYRLELSAGVARCSRLGDLRADSPVPVFTPNGLAIAYAGAQSAAGIRTVGGLSGSADHDDTLGAIFGGRPARIRDHY